jgi:hypothetical protein
MKIHIAIVSDQTLANLIPILMDPPDRVCLICSDAMDGRGLASRFIKLLEKESLKVETKLHAPISDIGAIRKYAVMLREDILSQYSGAEIILNATGGTKLMALAFVDVFRDIADKIIYTDTSHRRIEVFPNPSGNALSPVQMRNVLDVPHYLEAQGFCYLNARSDNADWQQKVASRKAICKYLADKVQTTQMQTLIGKMNFLADRALSHKASELTNAIQPFEPVPRGEWASFLTELNKAGLVYWRKGDRFIRFASAEAALFLRGGWLEEYAWHAARNNSISDIRCSVQVCVYNLPDLLNEFDLLACHANELLIIECKTLAFNGLNDNQIAYKIDSLGNHVRGLFGETWLLSARMPTDTLIERARLARIRIIGPDKLNQLPSFMNEWVAGRK